MMTYVNDFDFDKTNEFDFPITDELGYLFYAPPRQPWKDWRVENLDDYLEAPDDVLLIDVR